MRRILINRIRGRFLWKDEGTNSNWQPLPPEVRNAADIEQHFMKGMDQRTRGQYDRPRLIFADQAGRAQKHYSIDIRPDCAMIIPDFNARELIYLNEAKIWPAADRLAYLHSVSFTLPQDETDLNAALRHLRQHEPEAVEDYETELKEQARQAAEQAAKEHRDTYFKGYNINIDTGG